MSKHGGKEWIRLGDGSLPTEDQDSGLGHIVPVRAYNLVFGFLLVLTVVTVWVADHDFGYFLGLNVNLVVAIAVASLKAAAVTLFFMHLTWEGKLAWGIVIYPIFVFLLILVGTLGDSKVRVQPVPSPEMVKLFGDAARSPAQSEPHSEPPLKQ